MKQQLILTVLALAMMTGCASMPRHGEVVMKASDTEAHVLLNASDVSVGDKVNIYRSVSLGHKHPRNEKRLIGEGTVTRLMGDKYAAVEVPAGVEFREGDFAERK